MERVRTSLDPHRLFVIGICGLALILTLLPMVWLFLGPSIERGEVNFEFLASALSQRRLVRALTNTIEASLATSLCATIVGAVLALLVIRTDMPFRRIVSTFTVGSFITSSYLLAFTCCCSGLTLVF
jgi:iron(III) transport system permease protein